MDPLKLDSRWGNLAEFEHYASGLPVRFLCRLLKRCPRTLRNWRSGRRAVPVWAVDVLRLHDLESRETLRQITGITLPPKGQASSVGSACAPAMAAEAPASVSAPGLSGATQRPSAGRAAGITEGVGAGAQADALPSILRASPKRRLAVAAV